MKCLLVAGVALLISIGSSWALDAFDMVDKYCAANDQDGVRQCMANSGKAKVFKLFDMCARPLRRHLGNIKEGSKFICTDANEKENFMFRCCFAYQLRKERDATIPRIFEACLSKSFHGGILAHSTPQQHPQAQVEDLPYYIYNV